MSQSRDRFYGKRAGEDLRGQEGEKPLATVQTRYIASLPLASTDVACTSTDVAVLRLYPLATHHIRLPHTYIRP